MLKVRLPPFYLGSSQSSRDDGYRARSHAPVKDLVRLLKFPKMLLLNLMLE
jgi:hypothetical protein